MTKKYAVVRSIKSGWHAVVPNTAKYVMPQFNEIVYTTNKLSKAIARKEKLENK